MNAWRFVKEKSRKAGYFFTGKSDAEKLVYETTNSDPWGPANTQMQEIAQLSMNYKDYEDIRKSIWDRMTDTDEVRYVQKTLLLLEYLLRNGNESFRNDTKMNLGQLQALTSLQNHQVGEEAALEAVIRKKSADIIQMVNDNDVYKMEREKARKLAGVVTSVQGGGIGEFGSSMNRNDDDFNYEPPKKKTPDPPSEDDNDDEELDFDPRGKSNDAPPKQQTYDPFSAKQQPPVQHGKQAFDPFGGSAPAPQPKQQTFNLFGGMESTQRQTQAQKPQEFDVFAGAPARPAQPPPQGAQAFDVFASTPPKPAQQGNQDLFLFDCGPSPTPKPPVNDFMDLTTQPMAQNPPQQGFGQQYGFGQPQGVQPQRGMGQQPNQSQQKPKNDFDGLVNLDLKGGAHKGYGKAQVARGGQNIGGF